MTFGSFKDYKAAYTLSKIRRTVCEMIISMMTSCKKDLCFLFYLLAREIESERKREKEEKKEKGAKRKGSLETQGQSQTHSWSLWLCTTACARGWSSSPGGLQSFPQAAGAAGSALLL